MTKSDVIVVGAGLAGAAAALQLGRQGRRVCLLEASERFGGRGYLRAFNHSGPLLEFGGAWITPWHYRLRSLVAEHGLALRPRHPVVRRLWLREGKLHEDTAVPLQDLKAHERAIARVAADAILLKKGFASNERGEALTGLCFEDYLDRLQCPTATRALFSAWWTVSGNGDKHQVAASEFLSSCSYGSGLAEGMIDTWSDTIVPGVAELVERMVKASGAETVFSSSVNGVWVNPASVAVTTTAGDFEAKAVILALGMNQLAGIEFSPELPASKRDAIALGHGGRSFKLWIKAEGVLPGTLVTGDGKGVEFAFAERQGDDGSTYIVAFGLMNEHNHPGDPTWVRDQLTRLFPDARIISYDWHDWLTDPFARGTWVAALAGHGALFEAANWHPEGRIAFASSDFAPEQAGWFEGAVVAGEAAATAVLGFT